MIWTNRNCVRSDPTKSSVYDSIIHGGTEQVRFTVGPFEAITLRPKELPFEPCQMSEVCSAKTDESSPRGIFRPPRAFALARAARLKILKKPQDLYGDMGRFSGDE